MIFNQINQIDNQKGDYIIMTDYGFEGLRVHSQHHSIEEAISNIGGNGCSQAILKLVKFNIDIAHNAIQE